MRWWEKALIGTPENCLLRFFKTPSLQSLCIQQQIFCVSAIMTIFMVEHFFAIRQKKPVVSRIIRLFEAVFWLTGIIIMCIYFELLSSNFVGNVHGNDLVRKICCQNCRRFDRFASEECLDTQKFQRLLKLFHESLILSTKFVLSVTFWYNL